MLSTPDEDVGLGSDERKSFKRKLDQSGEGFQGKYNIVLKHPFTMVISGPTSCGKTSLVSYILQHVQHLIDPPPQRIVWLYKRWQPLYDLIQRMVKPSVEFIQGIPPGLEHDEFFNPGVRNLIVLDDLMSTATKDSRITDLFTEGSHHRNLSILCLNQNLYFSKDPTQRRNSHYIVLFKNPIDKQQIYTLARQMYPGNSEYFTNYFDMATQKPYGYLLVDLKQNTPDSLRLRPNVFQEGSGSGSSQPVGNGRQICPPVGSNSTNHEQEPVYKIKKHAPFSSIPNHVPESQVKKVSHDSSLTNHVQESKIKEDTHDSSISNQEGSGLPKSIGKYNHVGPTQIIDLTDIPDEQEPGCNAEYIKISYPHKNQLESKTQSINMHSCPLCGSLFKTESDLKHHMLLRCPERMEEEETRSHKWSKHDSDSDSEIGSDQEVNDNTVLEELKNKVYDENAKKYKKQVEVYMDEGMTENVAKSKANEDLLPLDRKLFLDKYGRLLEMFGKLKDSPLHRKIAQEIERLMLREDYSQKEAIKYALKKRKYLFDDLLKYDSDSEDDDDSGDDSDEEQEEEDGEEEES
jgi:hypothetical protein